MYLWMCVCLALERLVGFCYHVQSISKHVSNKSGKGKTGKVPALN
jgi:hypothetical protein